MYYGLIILTEYKLVNFLGNWSSSWPISFENIFNILPENN